MQRGDLFSVSFFTSEYALRVCVLELNKICTSCDKVDFELCHFVELNHLENSLKVQMLKENFFGYKLRVNICLPIKLAHLVTHIQEFQIDTFGV